MRIKNPLLFMHSTRYCQFCRQSFVPDPAKPIRLGDGFFCSASHSMRFFKGEEYEPAPQPQLAEPRLQIPIFDRMNGPKLHLPV